MKATLRLPTQDQYAFIEVETEVMSKEEAIESYHEAMRLLKPKEGISDRDFNAFLDRQLLGESNHVEEYQLMSQEQKNVVQAVKRALKRIEAKQAK